MKVLTLEIPDDPALVPVWLEGHLLGLDLHQVVTELEILAGASAEPPVTLQDLLGAQMSEVLQTGLRSLPSSRLRLLMKQPRLLLELQRLVLDEGGTYWTTVPESPATKANSSAAWEKIQAAIHSEVPKSVPAQPVTRGRRPWLIAGVGWLSAAALLVAFLLRGSPVQLLENQVAELTAKVSELTRQLENRPVLAAVPADLPEEAVVLAAPDPRDLPDDDPDDLPDLQ